MTEDERAIREVIATWMRATADGDTTTVISLMTDDVVFMVPGQEPFGKEAFAAASNAMQGATINGTSDLREIEVLGGLAYVRSYLEITVTPAGVPAMRRKGYTLSIFRKEGDGRWRLARDANLLTPTS
jgi:uncharacterized protein (TIGR02246 family)